MRARNLMLAFGLLTAVGCYVEPRRDVVVQEDPAVPQEEAVIEGDAPPPPALIIEDPGPAPVHGWVWLDGHWAWSHDRYVWSHGRWAAPPRPHATWTPGHWERRGRGHVWVSARWR